MDSQFDKIKDDFVRKDPNNTKWGIFYYNPKDKRVIVPKQVRSMGWTFNFGSPYTYIILILFIASIIFVANYSVTSNQ